ncbi:MAG: MarR family transcriptional regulator [Myxococcota bacterium]
MEPHECDRLGLDVWLRILQFQHVISAQLEDALRETGLPLTWYEVLIRLRGEAPMRMQDLASRLLVTQSGATRLVQRLEQAGLVERNASPEDLRGRVVTLTPQGACAIEAAIPVFIAAVRRHIIDPCTKRELATTHRVLGRLLEAHDVVPE